MPLTLERIGQLRKELEKADKEIDNIVKEFYAEPGAQNVGGNIGQISILHAELVEALAEKEREIKEKTKK